MTCLRLIYLVIIAFLAALLITILHLNMWRTSSRDEAYFKSVPPMQVPFEIDRTRAFDRLVNFFNLFKSQTQLNQSEESAKLSKFIETSNYAFTL